MAKEQLLLSASNDIDSGEDQLVVLLDSKDRPTELIHRQTGKPERSYSPAQLKQGVVLRKQSGKDLLVLKATDFDPDSGAKIEIRYLYSGLPPATFKSLNLELSKRKKRWVVTQGKSSKPVKSLRFFANIATAFGFEKAIGIKSITVKR